MGCQQIALLRSVFHSQLCAEIFEELESNLSSLNNYFYLEWLFPHQIQVYRSTWEPEALCLVWYMLLSTSYRRGSGTGLHFPTQMDIGSCKVWSEIKALKELCDLWGSGQRSPVSCSTSHAKAASLLGLDFEREAGYQLIITCFCFATWYFRRILEFSFPFWTCSFVKTNVMGWGIQSYQSLVWCS